jgi:hypothetical protein
MNLREGTRRLALLFGALGSILCGVLSWAQLQPILRQRTDHKQFEYISNSAVVQQERKVRQAGWEIVDPKVPARGPDVLPGDFNGWDIDPSAINSNGIKSIGWNQDYSVAYIETQDGKTLYPTLAPSAWSYLLIAVLPFLGFFVPWGAVRAIGWVLAGFVQLSQ